VVRAAEERAAHIPWSVSNLTLLLREPLVGERTNLIFACVGVGEGLESSASTLNLATRLREAAILLRTPKAERAEMHTLPSSYAIVEPPHEIETKIHVGQAGWEAEEQELAFLGWASPDPHAFPRGGGARRGEGERGATAVKAWPTGKYRGSEGGGLESSYEAEWLRRLQDEVRRTTVGGGGGCACVCTCANDTLSEASAV